jgi:predicted chitinase
MSLGMTLEDGWPECDLSDCDYATIPGTALRLPFRKGQPFAILQAFMRDLDQYIEPVMNLKGIGDEGSWTENNSVFTSNHKGATAFDYNWSDHAYGTVNAGWNGSVLIKGSQVPAVRELLAFYEGMVFWGNDWTSPKDSMHFQMGYNTFGSQNVARVQDFINRKIRADGYSTFRRGGSAVPSQPVPSATAGILSRAMGGRLSLDRYAQFLPAVAEGLRASQCTTADRIAMWSAQIGHESGGLFYTEEIASGAAYEGRADLGNTQPGDGVRFKGRSWIQVTGRHNYSDLSIWAHNNYLVPTATYFVDNPAELASDQYAGLGPAWYWTVARPDINALCDKRDLVTVTQRINGGQNGIDDRRTRYNNALAMGDELLALLTPELDEWDALMASTDRYASRSIYRTSDDKTMTALDAVFGADATSHMDWIESKALVGDPWSIQQVADLATGKLPNSKDPWAVDRARYLISVIQARLAAQIGTA